MKSLVAWMTTFLFSMLVPASVWADEPFAWTPAASPQVPYFAHTLTVLESGDVLAVGDATKALMAEVYHPGRDQWTPVKGAPKFPRFRHRAVKLPGGQVLLCGGAVPNANQAPGSLVEDAEIYDEDSGELQLTGKMREKRIAHTATAFIGAAGTTRVLVTGGSRSTKLGEEAATEIAEIYDPATREWTYTRHRREAELREGIPPVRERRDLGSHDRAVAARGSDGEPSYLSHGHAALERQGPRGRRPDVRCPRQGPGQR
jgi:hypothetical protein